MAEKNSAQTDRHYENNGHLAVNQQQLLPAKPYISDEFFIFQLAHRTHDVDVDDILAHAKRLVFTSLSIIHAHNP